MHDLQDDVRGRRAHLELSLELSGRRGGYSCDSSSGERGSQPAVLCGRNAVQLSPPSGGGVSLDALAGKLSGVGRVTRNKFLLRLEVDGYQLTVFPDGRAIIGGTDDIATARTLHAKYIGS